MHAALEAIIEYFKGIEFIASSNMRIRMQTLILWYSRGRTYYICKWWNETGTPFPGDNF